MATERWTYLGKKRVTGGTVRHAWRDESGDGPLLFKKLKAGVVGGIYEVDATRNDAGGVSVGVDVAFTNQWASDREVLVLEDRAEAKALERDRLERAGAKKDALEEAARPLLDLAARTRTQAGKAALVDYITRQIWMT